MRGFDATFGSVGCCHYNNILSLTWEEAKHWSQKVNSDTAQKLLQRGRRDAAVHPAWRAQAQDGVRAGFSIDGSLSFKLKTDD